MKTKMQTSVIKKTLLLALMLGTCSAWAEWVSVKDSNNVKNYIDPATIRKDGNLRKVWQLQNLKQRDTDGAMSRRVRIEYDCNGERYRLLTASTHSEPMASGKGLITTDFGNRNPWSQIPPGTASETVLKIVCAQ